MPERIHYRFDDEPPPAKKFRIEHQASNESPSRSSPKPSNSTIIEKHNPPNGPSSRPHHPSLTEKAKSLLPLRKQLPIWSLASTIRSHLLSNDILLLVGETGSGKSTQVPQFLLESPWCAPKRVPITQPDGTTVTTPVGGCIAITEPRRVAAITLARRVAEEMGTPLGSSSPASKVGYSVRFDNSTGPATRIKFLTEGMLLQEMLGDPWLRGYSAVVVDEVHERGVNVDLVMGFLKRLVWGGKEGRGGVGLKVVVMSATVEVEELRRFFERGRGEGRDEEEGADGGGGVGRSLEGIGEVEDEDEWSGFSSSDDEGRKSSNNGVNGQNHDRLQAQENKKQGVVVTTGSETSSRRVAGVSVCHIEGRQYPVKVIYSPEPVPDFVDAALRTIFQIHYKEPLPGDILVFLTGQETVESLEHLVTEYALGLSAEVPKLLVLPLFAALPQAAQQRVFQPTPPRTRKVILATNIAETSVTVSGVRFVIDCGKSKIKQFRTRLGLDSLLVKPISKSAAIQRKGRAGREGPGQCYRLYTEQDYLTLAESNTPEILRCDLSQAILNMKARGVDNITDFPFLDPPPRQALEKALMQLFQLGALTESGDISDTGLQIARLPLSVPLGRVLLAAATLETDCLLEVIDIISCLSVENVFLNLTSEETKEQAETARRALYRREGDHLTLLTTVQAYAAERTDRKVWAEKHFVSHRAMQAVMVRPFPFEIVCSSGQLIFVKDVRKQLRAQCHHLRLLPAPTDAPSQPPSSEQATAILKAFLQGFATNSARLFPDGSYKTIVGNQTVAIHPSSVLFGKRVEAIVYNEFLFTNRSYARGVSAVQMDWIGEVLGG